MEKDLYDEDIAVRYTLLTGEDNGYSGLANYYRERLLEEGQLTAQETGGDLPFFCDVIGRREGNRAFPGLPLPAGTADDHV